MMNRNELLNTLLIVIALFATLIFIIYKASPAKHAVITLDPNTTYQIMTGWETHAELGTIDYPHQFHLWRDTVNYLAANDLGINRVRLEIKSGAENPTDYLTQLLSGQITREEWRSRRYEIINDNDDPFVIDWGRFQMSWLDSMIDNVGLPLKQHLEARGERLYVNLCYVDFGSSAFEHRDFPEEYAELILAVYLHMQSRYGFVPDAVEVILEPDSASASWSGTHIGNAIVAAGNRLRDNGFSPAFIVPSTVNAANAPIYFDQIIQVPGASQYLAEIAYHRYCCASDEVLQRISSRAMQYGIKASMLEHIGSGHDDLHQDLKIGRNSAWQQFTLAYPTEDNGAQYYTIDISAATSPRVNIGSRTKFLRQYFKYIRYGAQRIGAAADGDYLDPLAFINTDGNYVVVIKASQMGFFSIRGLPPGNYRVRYTTSSEYDADAGVFTLGFGEALNANIPDAGVATVFAVATANKPPQKEQPTGKSDQ